MTAPILITGAGKRLGLALAKHFLTRGQPVVATYRSESEGIEAIFDMGATIYSYDFYDDQSLENLIEKVRHNHKALRGVIHNASDWLPEKGNNPSVVIDKMMKVHVHAPYRMNLALKDNLLQGASPYADIIHVTDYVTTRGSKKHIAYAASKAALDNMSLSFAAAYAPSIKVNSVAPALMMFNVDDTDEYKVKAREKSVMQKEGGADEFINAVDYLLSSQYITGETIHLNGGRHIV